MALLITSKTCMSKHRLVQKLPLVTLEIIVRGILHFHFSFEFSREKTDFRLNVSINKLIRKPQSSFSLYTSKSLYRNMNSFLMI